MADDRRIRFAQGVHAGLSQMEAARAAGYRGSDASLQQVGSRLRKDAVVSRELSRLRAGMEAAAVATREEVLQLLTEHLRADPGEFVRIVEEPVINPLTGGPVLAESGTPVFQQVARVDLKAALKAKRMRLLSSVKVRPDGAVEIKFHDVQGAADRLAKLLGWNAAEKIQVSKDPAEMSDTELKAAAAKLLNGN